MRKWNGNGDSYAKIVGIDWGLFYDEVKSRTELEKRYFKECGRLILKG
jgi:hypothetical protein